MNPENKVFDDEIEIIDDFEEENSTPMKTDDVSFGMFQPMEEKEPVVTPSIEPTTPVVERTPIVADTSIFGNSFQEPKEVPVAPVEPVAEMFQGFKISSKNDSQAIDAQKSGTDVIGTKSNHEVPVSKSTVIPPVVPVQAESVVSAQKEPAEQVPRMEEPVGYTPKLKLNEKSFTSSLDNTMLLNKELLKAAAEKPVEESKDEEKINKKGIAFIIIIFIFLIAFTALIPYISTVVKK